MKTRTPATASTARGHGRLVGVDVTKRTCAIENCARPYWAKGYCNLHWARVRRTGSPGDPVKLPLGDLVWSRVDRRSISECWEWLGHRDSQGYGRLSNRRLGTFLAHRLVFHLTYGYLPPVVRHVCDNPPCVNPTHLLPGTQADNTQDMARRGRSQQGVRHAHAKLTEEDVMSIRQRRERGERVGSLAAEFGVSHSLISHIIARRLWRHVV